MISAKSPPTTHINSTGVYTTDKKTLQIRGTMNDGSTEAIVVEVDYVRHMN